MKHPSYRITPFGELNNRPVECIRLTDETGAVVEVLTLGATWHIYAVPLPGGGLRDILVKPGDLNGYLENQGGPDYCFGASIGRYAGRIGGGGFRLNKEFHSLAGTDGVHLHGGDQGLSRKIWKVIEHGEGAEPWVLLSVDSADGEGGYPGELTVFARFQLSRGTCILTYYGYSDRDTVLNLTNHAYFNLSDRKGVEDLVLEMGSHRWLEADDRNVPTGEIHDLSHSPLDFRQGVRLGTALDYCGFLDHVFLLDWHPERGRYARLTDPKSGLYLMVQTNQPAVVVFAPRALEYKGKLSNAHKGPHEFPAICFETQNYPDAPNKPHFPSSLLCEGSSYYSRTYYRAGVSKGS